MAYAALVSLLQTSERILEFDPYFLPCTRNNFDSFKDSITSLISFLDDCSPICTRATNDLITKIRDAAYEAEDVLESLIATHFLRKYGSDRHERFQKFPRSLEEVIKNIESVAKEVKGFQKDGSGLHERVISTIAGSSGSASRGSKSMVALDNDAETRILEQLVGGRTALDIVSIVGMGGVGKTTLASILFHSQLIKETFDIRGWVTISQTYNAQEIVLAILKDIGVPLDGQKNGEQRLYQRLYGRKYLIVLDDVWSTQALDDIKRYFPENENNSRIILTTRHSEVATYANSCGSSHEMKLLNDDSSWRLLCKEIFLHKDCPPDLVEIGKVIAIRCQGLPLAISVIAGHLRKESMSKEYWKYVAENLNSVLKTADDLILEILSLSYDYLPHHLKACFLYIGLFPRQYEGIKVASMIKLWVAEGFVKPSVSNCVEMVAMEYLKDLIDRNLIFVRLYDSIEAPRFCVIHDLLKDVCTKEAQKEKFCCVMKNRRFDTFFIEQSNNQRRLVIDPITREGDENNDSESDDDDDDDDLTDGTDSSDEASPGTGSDDKNWENYNVLEHDSDSEDDNISEHDSDKNWEHDSDSEDDNVSEHDSDKNWENDNVSEHDDASSESFHSSEDDNEYPSDIIRAMSLIRSFLYHYDDDIVYDVDDDHASDTTSMLRLFSGLLKVLYVCRLDTDEFPVQVLELVNLRYLELRYVNQVPPLLSRLWNLQTLIIKSQFEIYLPLEVWEMPQLRHLQIHYCFLPEVLNFQVSETDTWGFKGLQTLSNVTNFRCTEEVLARILYLKKLKISFTRKYFPDWSFHCLNNLAQLRELESLCCKFWAKPNETLVRNISFPSSLKKLVLRGCRIPWEKMTIIGMLPKLEVLKLKDRAFVGSLWESNDDEFSKLKSLSIEVSRDLKEWRAEDYHFPLLRHLLLRQCIALEAIPCGIGEISTLEIIELHGCMSSVVSFVKDMLGEDSEVILKVSNMQKPKVYQ